MDVSSGRSRCKAFVQFDARSEAAHTALELHGRFLENAKRPLIVRPAENHSKHENETRSLPRPATTSQQPLGPCLLKSSDYHHDKPCLYVSECTELKYDEAASVSPHADSHAGGISAATQPIRFGEHPSEEVINSTTTVPTTGLGVFCATMWPTFVYALRE